MPLREAGRGRDILFPPGTVHRRRRAGHARNGLNERDLAIRTAARCWRSELEQRIRKRGLNIPCYPMKRVAARTRLSLTNKLTRLDPNQGHVARALRQRRSM